MVENNPHKVFLDHNYLLSVFEDLLTLHFTNLSEDFSDAFLAAELLRQKALDLTGISDKETNIFDKLAVEVDQIFSNLKHEVTNELTQCLKSFIANDVVVIKNKSQFKQLND